MTRLLIGALALVLLTGCGNATANSDARVIMITAADLPLPTPEQVTTDERIVALANGSSEILYALGFGAALVGRDIASTFPGSDRVPVVTSAHSVSAEKVLAQRPSLVIIDARTGPAEAITQIRGAGVRIESVPEAWTLTDLAPRIRSIGAVLGVESAAEGLLAEIGPPRPGVVEPGVVEPADSRARVAFLYLRGTASVYLLGGKGSGADALLRAVGANDVGAEANFAAFTPLTSEALIAARPEILLVMRKGLESVGGVDGLIALPGVAQTPAGLSQRVIVVDDEVLLAFGARTGALLDRLAQAIAELQP